MGGENILIAFAFLFISQDCDAANQRAPIMQTFVIMPYHDDFKDVYEAIKDSISLCRKLIEEDSTHPRRDALADFKPYRADEGHGAQPIMTDLLERIQNSQLCIADISGNNPNVLWELGYAMALKKPTIVLTQDVTKAPFDLSGFRVRPYDRGKLTETLVKALADEVAAVLRDVPEQFVVPEDFGHAQTLAMSTASPVYFLDVDWKIKCMNEAAVALFMAKRSEPSGKWVGKSLIDFINSFDTQLLNLAAIQKNLHVQKERLARAGNAKAASPLNIEPAILDSGP
jgi:nucleoside 2-deoxyribosyltransferase